ncbi:hypothetical protein K438DRAFT_928580 [Mycena galopus ATCC 62051]|nr:hypothetical protein K438DRAFT_928580 [Mycena galopus ATCC 62051]
MDAFLLCIRILGFPSWWRWHRRILRDPLAGCRAKSRQSTNLFTNPPKNPLCPSSAKKWTSTMGGRLSPPNSQVTEPAAAKKTKTGRSTAAETREKEGATGTTRRAEGTTAMSGDRTMKRRTKRRKGRMRTACRTSCLPWLSSTRPSSQVSFITVLTPLLTSTRLTSTPRTSSRTACRTSCLPRLSSTRLSSQVSFITVLTPLSTSTRSTSTPR